jgi:Imelysin
MEWVMKRLKTWSALGMASLGGMGAALAAPPAPTHDILGTELVFVAGEGGEAGGTDSNTTIYKLNSTDPTAFVFDARTEILAYANLAHTEFYAGEMATRKLEKDVGVFVKKPSAAHLAKAQSALKAFEALYGKTEAFRHYGGPIDLVENPLTEAVLQDVELRSSLRKKAHDLVESMEHVADAWLPGNAKNYRALFLKLDQPEALGRIVNGLSAATAGTADVWSGTGLNKLVALRNAGVAADIDKLLNNAAPDRTELAAAWKRVGTALGVLVLAPDE